MLGGKTIAAVFRRECITIVECQTERGRVRLDQDIRYGDLVLQVGTLARMVGVFMIADIEPWPAIERALAHAGDVIGNEVVAKTIALVGRTIGIACRWMNGEAHAIADAGGEDGRVRSVRVEGKHVGA